MSVERDNEAVSDERARTHAVLETLSDPHVLLRSVRDESGAIVDFEYLDANTAACEYSHVTADELIGARVLDFMPGQAAAGLIAQYRQVVESGEPLTLTDYVYEHEMLGGVTRRYDVRAVRLGDGLSYTWRDVTERHQAIDALAESDARFRLAFEAVRDTLALYRPVFDADGAFIDAEVLWMNRAARARWFNGASLEAMRGVRLFELRPTFREIFFEPCRGVVENGEPFSGVISMTHPTQGPIVLEAQITPFEGGFTYTSRDITAQRLAEEELRASEARFRLLAENASDVVATSTPDGAPTWISPSVEAVLGWKPEEFVQRPFVEFVHPDDRPIMLAGRERVGAGSPATYEIRVRTAGGGYRWMSISVKPIFDANGTFVGRVGGWRDIQAEVEARTALAESQALLRDTLDTLLDPLGLLEPVRDEDGRIVDFEYVDANEAALRTYGGGADELIGKRLLEVSPAFAGTEAFDLCVRTVETGIPTVLNAYRYPTAPADSPVRNDIRMVRVGHRLSVTWHDVTAHLTAQRNLERRVAELDALRRISQVLSESRTPTDVLDEVSDEIRALLGALCARIHVTPHGPDSESADATTSGSAGCEEFADCEAHFIAETAAAGEPVTSSMLGMAAHEHLAIPLIASGRYVGVIIAGREKVPFTEADIAVASTAAELVAASVLNATLNEAERREAAMAERQRIARDLHDDVTQSLYSANLLLEAAPTMWARSPEEGRRNLETLQVLIPTALAELRSLLVELQPSTLGSEPLEQLLQRLGDSFSTRSGVALNLDATPDLDLPDDAKLAFYRVAQEALANVGKHARATSVALRVEESGDLVRLVVVDDGAGFDPDTSGAAANEDAGAGGFGLDIMRDRAAEIGAKLTVRSVPGEGTRIRMDWRRPGAAADSVEEKERA